jgi:hypothetical protein
MEEEEKGNKRDNNMKEMEVQNSNKEDELERNNKNMTVPRLFTFKGTWYHAIHVLFYSFIR